FAYISFTVHYMRCCILLHRFIEISFRKLFSLFIVCQKVSHTAQGLATCKWPYRTVPFAAVSRSARPESRFPTLCGCQPPRSFKASSIYYLVPSFCVRALIRYRMKTPRNKAYCLPSGMQFSVFQTSLEELIFFIP